MHTSSRRWSWRRIYYVSCISITIGIIVAGIAGVFPVGKPSARQLALRALPIARFVPPRTKLEKEVGFNDQTPSKYSSHDLGHTRFTRYFRIEAGDEALTTSAVTAEVRATGWSHVKPRTPTTPGSATTEIGGEAVTIGWWTVDDRTPVHKDVATPYLEIQLIYNRSTTGGITYATP